jgi:hypothetical protein
MGLALRPYRSRRASPTGGFFVLSLPRGGDRIDEGLVVHLTFTRRDRNRLAMRLGDEPGGAHVWNPDLERAQSLAAQAFTVLAYSVAG